MTIRGARRWPRKTGRQGVRVPHGAGLPVKSLTGRDDSRKRVAMLKEERSLRTRQRPVRRGALRGALSEPLAPARSMTAQIAADRTVANPLVREQEDCLTPRARFGPDRSRTMNKLLHAPLACRRPSPSAASSSRGTAA